jgi:hypothetical protein
VAVDAKQIDYVAMGRAEHGHLRIQKPGLKRRVNRLRIGSNGRFQPAFRILGVLYSNTGNL